MAHLNKKCTCCGTKFSYCPDCSRADALKPSWASEFCSETCKDLWLTATKFNMKLLTKSEAKSIILGLDLKPTDEYVECIRRDLKNIMEKSKRGKRIEIQPVDDAIDIPKEIVETVVEELVAVEPTVHEVVLKEYE
jgi:hypothetical protein